MELKLKTATACNTAAEIVTACNWDTATEIATTNKIANGLH